MNKMLYRYSRNKGIWKIESFKIMCENDDYYFFLTTNDDHEEIEHVLKEDVGHEDVDLTGSGYIEFYSFIKFAQNDLEFLRKCQIEDRRCDLAITAFNNAIEMMSDFYNKDMILEMCKHYLYTMKERHE